MPGTDVAYAAADDYEETVAYVTHLTAQQHISYVVSGTDTAISYTMSGTDLAHRETRLRNVWYGRGISHFVLLTAHMVLRLSPRIWCYADAAQSLVLSSGMALPATTWRAHLLATLRRPRAPAPVQTPLSPTQQTPLSPTHALGHARY
eukprot:1257739-Rhodomonas_salina.2